MSGLRSQYRYIDIVTGKVSDCLFELLHNRGLNWDLDQVYAADYIEGKPTWPRTFVNGISKESTENKSIIDDATSFKDALNKFAKRKFYPTEPINLALSGGLDSQFLYLWLKGKGFKVKAHSLRSNIPNYCESSRTMEFARAFDVSVEFIEVRLSDFYDTLPQFLRAVEEPIYNFHPISKYLLARELRKKGVNSIVSGDGADQVFRGQVECDLFRFSKKSFASFGIDLVTPLASSEMESFIELNGAVLDKSTLYGMQATKHATFFPDSGRNETFATSLKLLREIACVG